jgi:hypothetical protein
LRICARIDPSSADTGSSRTTSFASARDRDALALAAGKFVREQIGCARGQADQIEKLVHAPPRPTGARW